MLMAPPNEHWTGMGNRVPLGTLYHGLCPHVIPETWPVSFCCLNVADVERIPGQIDQGLAGAGVGAGAGAGAGPARGSQLVGQSLGFFLAVSGIVFCRPQGLVRCPFGGFFVDHAAGHRAGRGF
jgi:hypothetical protein